VSKIQCYKSYTSITIHAIRGFLRNATGLYAIISIVSTRKTDTIISVRIYGIA